MTARHLLSLCSAASVLALSVFACVGDAADPPGEGQPCGGGCAAGLSCVNDVCTASPAEAGAADGSPGGADSGQPDVDAGGSDGGQPRDAAADVADDSCVFLPAASPGAVACTPGVSCATASQTCCKASAGGAVACNATCPYRASPVFLRCDGPDDCAAGAVCCLQQTKLSDACPRVLSYDADAGGSTNAVITNCVAPAACSDGFTTCNALNGCPAGKTCVQAKVSTGVFIGVCQ